MSLILLSALVVYGEVMQQVVRWIKASVHWLAEARPLWIAVGLVLVVFVLGSLLPGALDDRIRYCGLALELFGIWLVVLGLNEKLHIFNRPSLIGQFRMWLARRPPYNPKAQIIEAAGTSMGVSGCSAKLSVWSNPVDDSVNAHVAALESNVSRLKQDLDDTTKQFEKREKKQDAAIAAEHQGRERAIREVQSKLETFGVGGLQIEAIGAFWLMLGATLATISPEISCGLKALFEI